MHFLQKLNFTKEQLEYLDANASGVMIDSILHNKKLVATNIQYLIDLGIKNFREIFLEYYELFLLDNSNFVEIFSKYDQEDLVDKLEKNIAIIEYL